MDSLAVNFKAARIKECFFFGKKILDTAQEGKKEKKSDFFSCLDVTEKPRKSNKSHYFSKLKLKV